MTDDDVRKKSLFELNVCFHFAGEVRKIRRFPAVAMEAAAIVDQNLAFLLRIVLPNDFKWLPLLRSTIQRQPTKWRSPMRNS